MIDLAGDYIKHLPSKPIPREDLFCLGYANNYDYWLAFEEGKFKIYTYEWRGHESIVDGNHEDETWRDDCNNYFQGVEDYLDKDTCGYRPLPFVNITAEGIAYELWEELEDKLEDAYSITNNDGDGPGDKLINFIAEYLYHKAYYYYK